jgi:molybdopterin synthase catalytic subunit
MRARRKPAGTTRDNFNGRPVARLSYSAYPPLALQTLASIARAVKDKHALSAVAIAHRLGDVPVGDASVLIAVSSPHRRAAWRAGEEALEEVKRRAEIWKYEVFADGGGAWKANCEDAGTHGA